eukprot:752570-Hanusia_phi.AAC.5
MGSSPSISPRFGGWGTCLEPGGGWVGVGVITFSFRGDVASKLGGRGRHQTLGGWLKKGVVTLEGDLYQRVGVLRPTEEGKKEGSDMNGSKIES